MPPMLEHCGLTTQLLRNCPGEAGVSPFGEINPQQNQIKFRAGEIPLSVACRAFPPAHRLKPDGQPTACLLACCPRFAAGSGPAEDLQSHGLLPLRRGDFLRYFIQTQNPERQGQGVVEYRRERSD